MNASRIGVFTSMLIFASPSVVNAHYHMLLPDKPTAKTGEVITLTYQFGHPFEHQLFDTQRPKQLIILAPDGTKIDLTETLEKIAVDGSDGKKVTAFRTSFTPEKRGDYVVVSFGPPVKVEGEKLPLQDLVKVIVHVQTQNGWEQRAKVPGFLEPSPLTRPYGLVPGIAFRAEFEEPADGGGKPLVGALVEIERFNPVPPKELPPDEQITRAARTDRIGAATGTLTESGWWAVTANRDKDGVRQRGTLWVYVDGKISLEPAK